MGACVSAYVVREARHEYSVSEVFCCSEVPYGPSTWSREEQTLVDGNGRNLFVCNYRNLASKPSAGVVLFLHGSCGDSRDHSAKAEFVVKKLGLNAVLVDFGGCGRSTGRVTWGVQEQEDFHRAIEFVKGQYPYQPIGICAFSLGAAVALMCAPSHPEIACMVLDSSFSRLPEAIKHYLRCRLPGKRLHKPLARWVCRSVRECHGFNLETIAPVDYVHMCPMPLMFLGVLDDDVVPPEATDELHAKHPGKSQLLRLAGSHNGIRTQEVVEKQMNFLATHLSAAAAAAQNAPAAAGPVKAEDISLCCSNLACPSSEAAPDKARVLVTAQAGSEVGQEEACPAVAASHLPWGQQLQPQLQLPHLGASKGCLVSQSSLSSQSSLPQTPAALCTITLRTDAGDKAASGAAAASTGPRQSPGRVLVPGRGML